MSRAIYPCEHQTASAEKLLNLIPGDVGRSVMDIRLTVTVPNLEASLAKVQESLVPLEEKVSGRDGKPYRVRIVPCRTDDNHIDGVLMIFNLDQAA